MRHVRRHDKHVYRIGSERSFLRNKDAYILPKISHPLTHASRSNTKTLLVLLDLKGAHLYSYYSTTELHSGSSRLLLTKRPPS